MNLLRTSSGLSLVLILSAFGCMADKTEHHAKVLSDTHCDSDAACANGWFCAETDMGKYCGCNPSAETCDGLDNDCNGVVDDGAADDECQAEGSAGYCSPRGTCGCSMTACGGCIDVQKDVNNCGECGHVCTATAPAVPQCFHGSCQEIATPVSGGDGPVFFAVNEKDLYWSGARSEIKRASFASGAAEQLSGAGGVTLAMTLDVENVYWSVAANGAIYRVPLAGGDSVMLSSDRSPSFGLAVDETHVYWTEGFQSFLGAPLWSPNGRVMRAPKGERGETEELAAGQRAPWGLIVVNGNVYWADYGSGSILTVPATGGTPVALAAGQDGPTALTLHGSDLYWTNSGASLAENDPVSRYGSIAKMPLAGGPVTILVSKLKYPAWSLTVNDTHIYWLSSGAPYASNLDGAVMRASIEGGEPELLAENQDHPWQLAVVGSKLIWSVGANFLGPDRKRNDGAIHILTLP